MALGPRDTRQLVQLTGIDDDVLAQLALADNTPLSEVVAMMNGALGALNTELSTDPRWSAIASYTDQPTTEYRVGSSNGMEMHTEYGRPDAKRAGVEGHMLPLIGWDRRLGWTWDFLRKASMPQIEADIADAVKDVKDRFRLSILGRLLDRDDDSGASKGLGTGGYSPGFATAAANTNVDFTPPANEGTTFTSDHEHYVASNDAGFLLATITDARDELREHGHMPPYEAWVGTSDIATIKALTGFLYPQMVDVRYGVLQDVATVDSEFYFGVLEEFRFREVRGIPQYYGVFFKSYGPNSARNPLKIRLEDGANRPTVRAFSDPYAPSAGPLMPIQNLMLFTEFGVGVNDRTAATIRYVNSGTWADGTPT